MISEAEENGILPFTRQELVVLAEIDSRLFGFLKFNTPEGAKKKALLAKAVKYLEHLLVKHQQQKEQLKQLNSKPSEVDTKNEGNEDGNGANKGATSDAILPVKEAKDPPLQIKELDPRTFSKLGHLQLLLEDFSKALSAYQKYYWLEDDHWKDVPFIYGLGLVYFHFSAYQCYKKSQTLKGNL